MSRPTGIAPVSCSAAARPEHRATPDAAARRERGVAPADRASARPWARVVLGTALAWAIATGGPAPAVAQAPVLRKPLTSTAGLRVHNVTATAVRHAGRRGVRLVETDSARTGAAAPGGSARIETLALLEGTEFGDGVIELEVAGEPAPGAGGGARGFVGLAFRVQPDLRTYDAFYLRPTNGRADDQVRRNHSVQYIAHPDWPWERLRRESPERYESYVDLVPGAWTRIRIEVQGTRARLFVHGQAQPTLIVDDLRSGATGRGALALWIGPGTVAHFRDLRVRR